MRKKVVIAAILTISVVIIAWIAISSQRKPANGTKTMSFLISDSEQWIYEEFQGRRFQMVTYEENEVKMIFLVQVDWFLDPSVRWQLNEGHWYKDGSCIAISSGLVSNFTAERLDSDYLDGGLSNLEYEVGFDDFLINTSFSFNTTTYSSVTQAWRNSELEMLWKVG